MDDFIDKVAWGLNAVFSNGVGYPRDALAVFGGARDERAFKRYPALPPGADAGLVLGLSGPDRAQRREQRAASGPGSAADGEAQAARWLERL